MEQSAIGVLRIDSCNFAVGIFIYRPNLGRFMGPVRTSILEYAERVDPNKFHPKPPGERDYLLDCLC